MRRLRHLSSITSRITGGVDVGKSHRGLDQRHSFASRCFRGYRRQAQITEFNALNAAMAVVRFKQHFRLLDRLDEATWYIFDSAMLEIDS